MTCQQKHRIRALGIVALHTAIFDLKSKPRFVVSALLRIYTLEKCSNLRYLQAMTGWYKKNYKNESLQSSI